ncbi:hypothetical protein [Haloglomus litoreum]|uniref:hypothetical protein n=1 Tax=Haloglomus litoreum TaxID=3034026 RepID=UPI0023E8B9C4|nr:hypothetical protein [Haloglomus sp. DT116]
MSIAQVNGEDLDNLQTAFSTFIYQILSETESPQRFSFSDKFNLEFEDNTHIIFETGDSECLFIGPLSYRPGDSSESIEIYIQFGLTVRAKDLEDRRCYEVVKSATEVVYLRIKENEEGEEYRERAQGLHFDFDITPDHELDGEYANHPVFHAQYNPNCVDTSAIDRWDPETHNTSYPDYPRIPCAPFDFVSVIYMIMNDHLPKEVRKNKGWPQNVLHEYLPRFPREPFELAPADNLRMTPEWWYLFPSRNEDGSPRLRPDHHRPL